MNKIRLLDYEKFVRRFSERKEAKIRQLMSYYGKGSYISAQPLYRIRLTKDDIIELLNILKDNEVIWESYYFQCSDECSWHTNMERYTKTSEIPEILECGECGKELTIDSITYDFEVLREDIEF